MDLLDKKILCELDRNCRIPYSQIGRKVHASRAVVGYRVRLLEQNGIIKKYITSINLGKLGFSTYKVYFKLFTSNNGEEFLSYICSKNSIIHCIKTFGAFDVTAVIAVKSIQELDELMTDIKNKYSKIIHKYSLEIIVSSNVFGRLKFLLDEKEMVKTETFASYTKSIELDEEDKKILKILSLDASTSVMKIAMATKLGADSVAYRIKKLQKEGIVSNFRVEFSAGKLGVYHYVFLLNLKSCTQKEEQRLITWCQLNKKVIYINKSVGAWEYSLNVILKDIDDINLFVSSLEKDFSNMIDSYETILNKEVIKLTYYPH
ncbi:MAG: AsnC family transcriptional regulator [Candidatus Woesearchaeota archaeon]|jgi:Lrp/AsnC family leucine-responsive transcriptional regulator